MATGVRPLWPQAAWEIRGRESVLAMATTIVIVCPQCQKQVKGPADLEGRRVRCRACGHTFTVPAAEPSEPPGAKTKTKARSPAPAPKPEENKPYNVVDLDLTPRCPHCAAELLTPDAIVCVHCGYNSQTRQRLETKRALETSGMERFQWLLPGILCAVALVPLFGAVGYLWFVLAPPEGDGPDDWLWARVWGSVICGFNIWFLGRFAVKRLIRNPRPPEQFLQ